MKNNIYRRQGIKLLLTFLWIVHILHLTIHVTIPDIHIADLNVKLKRFSNRLIGHLIIYM